jgi:hypothetical protein
MTEREKLERLDPGGVLTRITSIADDWRYEQAFYETALTAVQEVETRREQLRAEWCQLTLPALDTIVAGEGDIALHTARCQRLYADALVHYHCAAHPT